MDDLNFKENTQILPQFPHTSPKVFQAIKASTCFSSSLKFWIHRSPLWVRRKARRSSFRLSTIE
ncbi:hypothetical protein V6Z11_D06G096400 [Gossypium hirsutum]